VFPAESGAPADERDEALGLMLAKLPPGQRAAVVLVHVYGWRYQDVADVVGRSLSDVRNDVHRGLLALRAAMGAGHGR
jgi:DNA-directed RNA polymerase specialized sigma24 family protein